MTNFLFVSERITASRKHILVEKCSCCGYLVTDRPKEWNYCPKCGQEIYGRKHEGKVFIADGKRVHLL